MENSIRKFNQTLEKSDQQIAEVLTTIINENLYNTTSKIWHSYPVWFLDENPIVGYSKQKKGIRLMFWSGKSFDEPKLNVLGGKFQDASIFYNLVSEINEKDLKQWLQKSQEIQWDYKNIVKRKGELIRLK